MSDSVPAIAPCSPPDIGASRVREPEQRVQLQSDLGPVVDGVRRVDEVREAAAGRQREWLEELIVELDHGPFDVGAAVVEVAEREVADRRLLLEVLVIEA